MPVNTSITFRKGSATQWSDTNPVLASGEPGYDLTNNILKIGDGTSAWNSLNNHKHASIDITDFNSSVSGLLPVKNILAGTDISVSSLSGIFTITNTRTDVDRAASIVTNVFNNTGSPIPKMAAVYINGGQGDQPTIQLAIATGDTTSAATYGLTYESIGNMSAGRVIIIGALSGVNTDQFNPSSPHGNVNGQILYLSPTVSGALTTVKPSAPNHIVALGTIVRTHQNEGVVEVRVQNGFELEELHNVAISGATSGQFLQYNSVSGLWIPSSSGNFTTLGISGTNILSSASEINTLNGVVPGLVSPNKAVIVNSSKDIDGFRYITASGVTVFANIGNGFYINHPNNSSAVEIIRGLNGGGIRTYNTSSPYDNTFELIDGKGTFASGVKISDQTASTIASFDSNKNIVSLLTDTYPSLTELSYVKGVSSGIQTQLNNKSNIGHTHTSSDITNFNSSVSGLVNGIYAPLNSPNFSGIPTVPTAVTGTNTNQAASTAFVRSEISNLVDSAPSTLDTLNELAAALGDDPNFATTVTNLIGNKVNKSGDTITGTLIISPTGAISSGLIVSSASETNLQNVLTIDTNNYLTIESNTGSTITTENNTIGGWNLTGCEVDGIGFFSSLQLNGTDVSVSGHTHSSSDITNFNTGVSGLLPSVTGSGYVSSSFSNNIYTISVNGLQPSGNYSIVGHTHTASNITDFNSSVSGLLPTISNALNNRLLTSTGTSVGINAEANLTFDGSILSVIGQINIDDITLNTNIISTNTTNTDLILKPNGNGSLIADNAGNPRGIYSNDFQRERTSISGVAAGGYNVICGGSDNRTSNSYSTVGGGQSNTASNAWALVCGGDLNTASGNRSVICGGGSNTSSGQSSTIGGGSSNQSTGAYSIVPGGFRAKATRQGELSHAGGYFNTIGDAQHTILIARRLTTDATADVVLTLNGLAPVSTNILNIPAQTMWTFGIKLSAYNVTNNEAAWWIFRGGIKRNNANSTVLVGSLISESGSESSLSTATATVVADDTNEALEIRVTGVSGKNIRWVAVADISQVSYGTP